MLFENTLFSVLKNKKQKIVFGWQTCFLWFFCYEKLKTVLKNNSQQALTLH